MGLRRNFVKSRADFFMVLADARAETKRLPPDFPHLASIAAQLDAMAAWTADGCQPTPEERRRITIGTLVIRELDSLPEHLYDYRQKLLELSGYFKEWLSDEEVAQFDESDLLSDFDD